MTPRPSTMYPKPATGAAGGLGLEFTARMETGTMATHKTTVGVDTARLLVIDPLYLGQVDWSDNLADLPEVDPKTGFVKVGPAGLGLVVGPTGKGDGQYDVEVETFEDPVGYTRVARLTMTFDAAQVGDNPIDLAAEAGLEGQDFKGWLPEELRTAEARRLADHEDRLRRLEAWVAGTEFTNEEGKTYYPLAAVVSPWADPKEVTRLIASEDNEGLDRLIRGGDPVAGLPDEAVSEGEIVIETYPLRLVGKGLFVAGTSSYPKDLGYLLRSVEEKPEAVLHFSLDREGLLFTPPHQEGLYQVEAVWANTPDPEDPPRLLAVTIRLDHFEGLQEPTKDNPFGLEEPDWLTEDPEGK